MDALRPHLAVLGTRWHAGRLVLHVLSAERPEGFEPVPPDPHDLYFHTVRKPAAAAAA